jgi:hypothetical protein
MENVVSIHFEDPAIPPDRPDNQTSIQKLVGYLQCLLLASKSKVDMGCDILLG